jgi:hypothetical protein
MSDDYNLNYDIIKIHKAAVVLNDIMNKKWKLTEQYDQFNGEKYIRQYLYDDQKDRFYNSLELLSTYPIIIYDYDYDTEVKPAFSKLVSLSPIREGTGYDLFTDILETDPEKLDELYNKIINKLVNKGQGGGKRKSKGKSKKVSKKPVVSQKKQSIYKEILGKKMKIYKMPDSRKEYVKYKGELHHITHYKNLMKQKAIAKPKQPKQNPKSRNKI